MCCRPFRVDILRRHSSRGGHRVKTGANLNVWDTGFLRQQRRLGKIRAGPDLTDWTSTWTTESVIVYQSGSACDRASLVTQVRISAGSNAPEQGDLIFTTRSHKACPLGLSRSRLVAPSRPRTLLAQNISTKLDPNHSRFCSYFSTTPSKLSRNCVN